MTELVIFAVRLALAVMWIVAAAAKLKNQAAASQAVVDFNLLPVRVAKAAGYVLPWFEMLLGLLLVFGVFIPFVAAMSFALLCAFSAAIGVNLARGRVVSCQCFGSLSNSPLSFWSLVRNAILGALFVTVALYSSKNNAVSDVQLWQAMFVFLSNQKNNLPAVLLLVFSGIVVRELLLNFFRMMLAMGQAQDGPMRGTFEDKAVRRLRSNHTT